MNQENENRKQENYQEKKKLVELVFGKAKKISKKSIKTPLSEYLEAELNTKISHKTLSRYYDVYILDKKQQFDFNADGFDVISSYIGYESFADFCNKNFPENDNALPEEEIPNSIEEHKNEDEKEISQFSFSQSTSGKKSYLKGGVTGLGIAAIIGFSSYFGINGKESVECMYWGDLHYEKISCDKELHPETIIIPYDEQTFKYFYKIEPSDTTVYFRAGEPIVWYLKVNGEVEFYSSPGKHPINGKQLKPVTTYIVDKYGVPKK